VRLLCIACASTVRLLCGYCVATVRACGTTGRLLGVYWASIVHPRSQRSLMQVSGAKQVIERLKTARGNNLAPPWRRRGAMYMAPLWCHATCDTTMHLITTCLDDRLFGCSISRGFASYACLCMYCACLCMYCATTVRACASTVRLLCDPCTPTVHLLYTYCATTVQYCMTTVRLLCDYCTGSPGGPVFPWTR
jgi:hypothetical protein